MRRAPLGRVVNLDFAIGSAEARAEALQAYINGSKSIAKNII